MKNNSLICNLLLIQITTTMKLKLSFAIAAVIAFSFSIKAQVSSDKEGAAREWIASHSKDLKINSDATFKLFFVYKGLAGETLRFQHMINNVPVYQSQILVNFNPSNELAYTSSKAYNAAVETISTTPAISKEAALDASRESLKFTCEYSVAENDLFVARINEQTKLVYRVVTNPVNGSGSWEVMVDAQNGSILSTKDVALYHHKESTAEVKEEKPLPMVPFAAPSGFVTGTAMVYMSDPLSFAHVTYGTAGYTDNNDADTAQLTAARSAVTLPEIDLTGTVYKLKSSYVEIKDFETPSYGLFTQATSDFNFTRNNDAFEAVNAFYQLDKSLRYINETLGIVCKPTLHAGVLWYDPSGLQSLDEDNSHYVPSTDSLAFGAGCVDDAEDADVIWHELGHGLHDWMTGGSTAGTIGEGNGDYWAQSYSRSLAQWTSAQSAYHWMFNWDGHNACWAGRTTNFSGNYPAAITGSVHTDGQIWSTALMKIWDLIGRTKTDKMFLEGLALTDSSFDQNDAAIALRQAAINMNYPCADITVITQRFAAKGYTMPALDLTMAEIANQTVTADATNTYTLPSYAALANPIVANCNATLTQDPVVGTVLVPGVYTITMVATSGTSETRTFQLTVNPFLGVADNVKNNFVLYPNPATNVLNVKGDFDANESIIVYNMLGQVMLKKAISSNDESIDISSLAEGIYNVYFNTAKASYKFVKK